MKYEDYGKNCQKQVRLSRMAGTGAIWTGAGCMALDGAAGRVAGDALPDAGEGSVVALSGLHGGHLLIIWYGEKAQSVTGEGAQRRKSFRSSLLQKAGGVQGQSPWALPAGSETR